MSDITGIALIISPLMPFLALLRQSGQLMTHHPQHLVLAVEEVVQEVPLLGGQGVLPEEWAGQGELEGQVVLLEQEERMVHLSKRALGKVIINNLLSHVQNLVMVLGMSLSSPLYKLIIL